ncbi:MAG: branched-chain amino acid transport system ATP-binding protein [Clostridia bacterium]|nr:branched-chain amino acid transport system ATP-binding protein [Clostridia bacterium]
MMGVLRTERVSIDFGGLRAVDNLDFQIGDEIVGLIGPNGSGKTTFLNIISGIYKPTRGRVYFNGEDITSLPPHMIRAKGIARTFQTNRLCLNLSILDNMLLGLYCQQQTTWWQAIFMSSSSSREIKLGIEKSLAILAHFNPALITRAYEPVMTIPLIDRRRIEIARAVVGDPRLVLLDEPTAGLNSEETNQMINDIAKIRRRSSQISIIIIEHDMTVISRITERVVCLNAGQKIAEGTFSEVARNELVRTAYLGG